VDGDERRATSFLWDVGADLIDLEHLARRHVALRVKKQDERLSTVTRFGIWPVLVVGVLVIGITTSVPMAIGAAVVALVTGMGARRWNRGAAKRLAARLRDLPAASEPFTFRADVHGTHGHSKSSSEDLSWSRYRSVQLDDDLVALELDTGMMRLLPTAGLVSGQPVTVAVDTISGWIGAARSDPGVRPVV
jgi:hypothetical protein